MAENKLAVIVGENISDRRRRLGFSQKELAERLGISQDAMARMERGKIAPKMGRLQDIADNLQCTVAFLFRTHDDATDERAANIADILKALPADGQEALVELVANAARVMSR
jgi:transcriptional regulator with XRE-family HTH domain